MTFDEEEKIIETFCVKEAVEDFSVIVSYDDLEERGYSLSAGQYFEVKIEYIEISHDHFKNKLNELENNLNELFQESEDLEKEIRVGLKSLNYE